MVQLPVQVARVFWAGISTTMGTVGCITHATVTEYLNKYDKESNWRFLTWWAKTNTHGIEFIPEYSDKLMQERPPCIFVVNHQSFFDIFAMFLTAPWHIRFVGKRSLFKIPVLGQILRHLGTAEIDRGNRTQAIDELNRVAEDIKAYSLVIFPEGTRSKGRGMLPFKKGAFHLAINHQIPIVPVSIKGSAQIMPAHTWKVTNGRIQVVYGDPIETKGMTKDDLPALLQRVRSEIDKNLSL